MGKFGGEHGGRSAFYIASGRAVGTARFQAEKQAQRKPEELAVTVPRFSLQTAPERVLGCRKVAELWAALGKVCSVV